MARSTWLWLAPIVSLGLATAALADEKPKQLSPEQLISTSQMMEQELKYYKNLSGDDATSFIVTRSYVRIAQKVIDRKMRAIDFPDRPQGFSVKYLLPDDVDVINEALGDHIYEQTNGQPSPEGPASERHLKPGQLITPAQMTPKELTYYKTLKGDDATSFIVTRSYVRLAQQVVDKKLAPLDFPDRPQGFTRRYLLPGDEQVISTAQTEYIAAAAGVLWAKH